MTKAQIFAHKGTYEDFKEGSSDYYAQLAYDWHGMAVRDNTYLELVSIGKGIEANDFTQD